MLKQVIKDEDGNFKKFIPVNTGLVSSNTGSDIDLSDIENRLDTLETNIETKANTSDLDDLATKTELEEVSEVANNALSKSGGEMTGDLKLNINELVTHPPESSAIRNITIVDNNQFNLAQIFTILNSTESKLSFGIRNRRASDNVLIENFLRIGVTREGTAYSVAPPSRDNYDQDIVTTKYFKDNTIKKQPASGLQTFYVDAINGSDTAELYTPKKTTIEYPFKSIQAAINYIIQNYAGTQQSVIRLLSDISETAGLYCMRMNNQLLMIRSNEDNNHVTLTTKGFTGYNGAYDLRNINIVAAPNTSTLVHANGHNAVITISGLTFNGVVSNATVAASLGGRIVTYQTFEGTVTGKRYSVTGGSIITTSNKGAEAFPGSEAGTCDAISHYA